MEDSFESTAAAADAIGTAAGGGAVTKKARDSKKLMIGGGIAVAALATIITVVVLLVNKNKKKKKDEEAKAAAEAEAQKPAACDPACTNGTCTNGTCVCADGWTGPGCTEKVQPPTEPYSIKADTPYRLLEIYGFGSVKSYSFTNRRLRVAGTDKYLAASDDLNSGDLKIVPKSSDPLQLWSGDGRGIVNLGPKRKNGNFLRFATNGTVDQSYLLVWGAGAWDEANQWLFDGKHFYPKWYSDKKEGTYRLMPPSDFGGAWMEKVDPKDLPTTPSLIVE